MVKKWHRKRSLLQSKTSEESLLNITLGVKKFTASCSKPSLRCCTAANAAPRHHRHDCTRARIHARVYTRMRVYTRTCVYSRACVYTHVCARESTREYKFVGGDKQREETARWQLRVVAATSSCGAASGGTASRPGACYAAQLE